MNMNDQIELLSVPLPEDVLKHKWHGDFAAMERIMDRRLAGELSDVMRRRLLLEKKIIKRLPRNYPYSWEDACRLLADTVENFQSEELREIMDSDYADWIYRNGEPHFRGNMIANLFKTRPDYAARRKDKPQGESEESRYLREALEEMRREGGMDRIIRLRTRLWLEEDAGVEPGERVRVWLPLPAVDAQVKAVRVLDDGVERRESGGAGNVPGQDGKRSNMDSVRIPASRLNALCVAPENAGQRTIFWDVNWQPGMEFTVEYEYDIQAGYIDLWRDMPMEKPDGEKFQAWKEKYACFDPVTEDDLSEQQPHIIFSTMMKELTAQVVGEETRPLEKARRIYDYVTTKIHYSYMRSYVTLPAISEYVASGHKGDCGAQSILFITMCRCAGIPARWQSGLYANPVRVGNHDWARFYIEEYGWLYADCSFGGGAYRNGNEERRRFYFGNLEPFRMTSCRRFQTNFQPPMESLRNDPYDAQSGEVELQGEKHDRYPWDSETIMTEYR